MSLARVPPILAAQKRRFVRGMCPHAGQPCQKQPSTNTASLEAGNKKSGFPRRLPVLRVQPDTPARTSANRNRTSVVRLPCDLIARIIVRRTSGTFANAPPCSMDRRALSICPRPQTGKKCAAKSDLPTNSRLPRPWYRVSAGTMEKSFSRPYNSHFASHSKPLPGRKQCQHKDLRLQASLVAVVALI
jgi:hypothetical protein